MATKKAAATKVNEDVIVHIPLSEIDADFKWNSRSGILSEDSGDDERSNFSELKSSIRANGQDTPVDVRLKKSGKGYLLTTGFRRFTALKQIADEDKNKTATVKAIVRNDNEVQARARNLRENAARDNLKGADLAYGVHDLYTQYKAAGGAPSSVSISAELGKNQGYINRLMNIMQKCKPSITQTWREAPFAITVNEMLEISKYEPDRQEKAFEELLKAKGGKAGDATRGKDGWIDTAVKKAETVGQLLGSLEKAGLINTDDLDFDIPEHLALCVKFKKEATPGQRNKIAKALSKSYEAALNAPDPKEGSDKED